MKLHRIWFQLATAVLLLTGAAPGCADRGTPPVNSATAAIRVFDYDRKEFVMSSKVIKTEQEWKKLLTAEQFSVLRKKGTEAPGTGKYANHHEHGVYRCAGCGLDLFRSEDKYESGTGWPSFFAPVAQENIETLDDNSLFSRRTEVICRRCGGHLGHVFNDGPRPTGLRYCMNSAALDFVAIR